nr:MAG TPA: hypothetical protein [Caudoviricetes sp.]
MKCIACKSLYGWCVQQQSWSWWLGGTCLRGRQNR